MKDESPFTTGELLESLESLRTTPLNKQLPLREEVCSDCAVKCGLYTIYSEALRLTDQEEQIRLSEQWFCHQTPSHACRGNTDNIGISHLLNNESRLSE